MSKKKHYYYRTLKTSVTGQQIQSLQSAMNEVNAAAEELAKECGARAYENSNIVASGGIVYFTFAQKPDPTIWQYLRVEDGEALYIPKAKTVKGDAILRKMNNLPVITGAQHNAAIGVDERQYPFAFVNSGEHIYISSHSQSPREDLTPVTEEEYNYAKNCAQTDC